MNNIKSLFTSTGITDSDRVLHTPSEFAKNNLLYVQEVGKLKSLKPHKSQREKLDSFLLLEVLKGEGTITIGENRYKVKKGNVVFINCMGYYAHESSMNNPWELLWVHFNGTTAKAYFDLFLEQNGGKNFLRLLNAEKIKSDIVRLIDCQNRKDLESELLSDILIKKIIYECLIEQMHLEDADVGLNRVECNEIRECINERYREEDLLDLIADRYGMQIEDLDKCFHKIFGITLSDYILNRRFTVAKELLRFTVKPESAIIEESGIKNEDLFRKLFQEGEGMSAEEYRMKWSQWVK